MDGFPAIVILFPWIDFLFFSYVYGFGGPNLITQEEKRRKEKREEKREVK